MAGYEINTYDGDDYTDAYQRMILLLLIPMTELYDLYDMYGITNQCTNINRHMVW